MSDTLAKNLKRYLEQQGLGMIAFANKAGVSPSTVCDIANGKASPQLKTLEKIATAMGTTVEQLLKEDE